MVSKASEDLPEPDRPVNTTRLSRGMATSMFFRLCSRAPRMVIWRASRASLLLRSAIAFGTLYSTYRLGFSCTQAKTRRRPGKNAGPFGPAFNGRRQKADPLPARTPDQAQNRG